MKKHQSVSLLLAVAAAFCLPVASRAADSTWAGASAAWSSNASPGWNGTGVPNAQGAGAYHGAGASATVTVDGDYTVGTITQLTTGTATWSIGGTLTAPRTITLDQDGAGAGTATISNASTSGATTGVLSINGSSSPNFLTLSLSDKLLIQNTSSNTSTNGAIQFGSNSKFAGAGDVTIDNSYTTINATNTDKTGYVVFGGQTSTLTGNVNIIRGVASINGNAKITADVATNVITIGGSGDAALHISGASTLAQNWVISGSAGTKTLAALNTTANTLNGTGTLNGDLVLQSEATTTNYTTLAGIISGTGGINKTGAGNARLNKGNTYTGDTKVSSGVLDLNLAGNVLQNSALDTSGAGTVTLTSLGTTTLTLGGLKGGTDLATAFSSGFTGTVTSLILNPTTGASATASYSGAIANGAMTLTKNGAGTQTLSGSNSYSGGTTLNVGTLVVGHKNALGSGGITFTGGTLQASTDLSGGNKLVNTGTLTSVTVSGANNLELGGKLTGLTGGDRTLTSSITGGNTLTLNDVDINTEAAARLLTIAGSGNTTIKGTLANGAAQANKLTITNTGTTTLSGNSTFTGAFNQTGGGNVSLTGTMNGPANVTINNASAVFNESAIGAIQGASTTFTLTNGSATLSGSNSYGGLTTLTAGTLILGNNNALGTGGYTSTAGTLQSSTDLSGPNKILNTGTLNTALTVSGANNLELGGKLTGNSVDTTLTSSITGGNLLTLNDVDINNNVSNDRTLTIAGTGNTTINGIISNGAGLPGRNNKLTITNSGTTTLANDSNTYSGITTINAGVLSVVKLANGGALSSTGTSGNSATQLVIDGGTLKYTGTGASTDRRFSIGVNGGAIDASGSGALNFSNTAATATTAVAGARTMTLTGTNTGDNKLAGVIADNGGAFSLTKDGTGKWILTGSNSYTGATTVTNGTLLADNSTGSATGNGVLTINGSAILGGFGIISGSTSDVTVNGTLAPGDPSVNGGIGTLTIGTSGTNRNTVLAEGSTFSIQTGAGENNCDKLVMFGGFDLSGSQTLALTGTLDGVSNYIIATYTGSLTGTFETVTGLGGYSVDYGILNAKAITLIVPEPGTFAMLLGGIGMLLGFRRSRKSRV